MTQSNVGHFESKRHNTLKFNLLEGTEMLHLSPRELETLLEAYMLDGNPVLITGKPGVGKTSIVEQVRIKLGFDPILTHPAVEDPTVVSGLPWPKTGNTEATFLPFGALAKALAATTPTLWFIDDLGQASPEVQKAYMQLLLARRVNGHILPDCVTFVAATNRRGDRAGVSGILEPVKSRFGTIVELDANLDDWSSWAYGANIGHTLIAFLRYRAAQANGEANETGLLSAFEPTADLTNSPTPRTWQNLAKAESYKLPAAIEAKAFAGAVGEAAANEYLAFRSMANSLVNLDTILLDPARAPIPTSLDQLYATVIGLAGRANDVNFAKIATYATRLAVDANHGEFAVLLVRDAQRRDPKITYSSAFTRHITLGPIGKLFTGQD